MFGRNIPTRLASFPRKLHDFLRRMGGDEILSRVWLADNFDNECILQRKISTIIQVSAQKVAASVCAAFQKSGVELVCFGRDDDEHPNLLPVFADMCNFVDKQLRQKKSVLFWERGGGTACLVAYVMSAHRIGYSAALHVVREERPVVGIGEEYVEQLKVWQRCGFNVYDIVKGRKKPKKSYLEWIERESAKRATPQLDQYCVHS